MQVDILTGEMVYRFDYCMLADGGMHPSPFCTDRHDPVYNPLAEGTKRSCLLTSMWIHSAKGTWHINF